MIKLDDLRLVSYAIPATKRATTGVSAAVDCADCHEIMVIHTHGKDTNSSAISIKHAASTNAYASSVSTAFSTVVSAKLATSGAQAFIIRNAPSLKRYLIIKLSATAASSNNGVLVLGFRNRAQPYNSTLGAFSAVTVCNV